MILQGGPVYVDDNADVETLARAHLEQGYKSAYCPEISLDDPDQVRKTEEAFKKAGVVIAEVGAWCNIIPSDSEKHEQAIEYVSGRLALADAVGALCCVTFAGTRSPDKDFGPSPEDFSDETFDCIVETTREIIRRANPTRARFGLEMMQTCPPDSVDSYLDLIKTIDSPSFCVHLDPCNIVYSPRQCFSTADLLRDCVKQLGPWIVCCHAKDLVPRDGLAVHIDETRPGTGCMDYPVYVEELSKLDRDVPLLLEHLESREDYEQARDYIASLLPPE
ncbi:MAG: sugar phosphate isomerase/epimerase [Lentisphaerae bacterium]|nr:sugar phosphate isomerase/epimerase [Lentisphaerota bacterium]